MMNHPAGTRTIAAPSLPVIRWGSAGVAGAFGLIRTLRKGLAPILDVLWFVFISLATTR
jgi:hypothetical protein